jgi:ribosomal protein S12 methylthiotransferase accessory factor
MRFDVSFPGGVMVDATYRGLTVRTDQPAPLGGDSAMSPFDLLFASLATCMGFYALRFCQERGLSTEGLGLTLEAIRDRETKKMTTVNVALRVPEGFPAKYAQALHRAVDLCAVKKVLMDPPQFQIEIVGAETSVPA